MAVIRNGNVRNKLKCLSDIQSYVYQHKRSRGNKKANKKAQSIWAFLWKIISSSVL